MTALIWLLPLAALVLGLKLRSGRICRLTALVDALTAELAKQDANADRARRLARYRGLQTAMERARTRQALAERDDAHMEAARTLRRVWALEADNERLVGWTSGELVREIGAET